MAQGLGMTDLCLEMLVAHLACFTHVQAHVNINMQIKLTILSLYVHQNLINM